MVHAVWHRRGHFLWREWYTGGSLVNRLELAAMGLKPLIYQLLKYSNDVNAVQKGKVGRRVGRRVAGKATGKAFTKLFKPGPGCAPRSKRRCTPGAVDQG